MATPLPPLNFNQIGNTCPMNTDKDEITPFIFSDSQTLYFSSKGHIGLGGFDVFVSTIDDKGYFSETKNERKNVFLTPKRLFEK